MDLKKELEELFDDPLLEISSKEASLFDIPNDMRKVMESKKQPDYVAQHKRCEDFALYQPLFKEVHEELRSGKRSLIRVTKTASMEAGGFYIVSGQMLYLDRVEKLEKSVNGTLDGRTRCIYENGTESDILLQTLRKNVVAEGYAITPKSEELEHGFFSNDDIGEQDSVTGYIYVLRSLSEEAAIKGQSNLYKIGFSTTAVEERIANAANEPTYLMAPVEIVASYKVVNLHSQRFEDMIHQILKPVQFHLTVYDHRGEEHHPQEWFVVPLDVVDVIIEKILDGSIVNYTYNAKMNCLEKVIIRNTSTLRIEGLKVLTLCVRKSLFESYVKSAEKKHRIALKQSNLNKYTYIDEGDGKRYLRRYDAVRFFEGYTKEERSALIEIVDITFDDGWVDFYLGEVLETC